MPRPRTLAAVRESIWRRREREKCEQRKLVEKEREEKCKALVAKLRALAGRGLCQADAVRALGLRQSAVSKLAKRYGIAFPKCDRVSMHQRRRFTDDDRAKAARVLRGEAPPPDVEADTRERRARALAAACERAGVAAP